MGIPSHTKAVQKITKSTLQLNLDATNGVASKRINKPTLFTDTNKSKILLLIKKSYPVNAPSKESGSSDSCDSCRKAGGRQ